MDDDILFYLDGTIGLTVILLLCAVAALAGLAYLEQRALVCGDQTVMLHLYGSEISRLWHSLRRWLLCI